MTEGERAGEGVRVSFRLVADDDGYPPADWENLWAEALSDGRFRLDNTPFFAVGVSLGDIVYAIDENGRKVFSSLSAPSGHSTLRIVLLEPAEILQVRARLTAFGCATELSHLPNLVAVDVPPGVSLNAVRAFLDEGQRQSKWEYETSAIRH